MQSSRPTQDSAESGLGRCVVFWGLIALSLATFAPCILLPEWRNYQYVRTAEQAQFHRLNQLQNQIDQKRRMLRALRTDPAAIARLAQRDLSFHRFGEQVVRVAVPLSSNGVERFSSDVFEPLSSDVTGPLASGVIGAPFVPTPVEPPAIVARALRFLPAFDYDSVFNDKRMRPMVLGLSIGLLVFSFWLFSGGLPAASVLPTRRAGQ